MPVDFFGSGGAVSRRETASLFCQEWFFEVE
jgi:hypothetical protein